MTVAFHNRTASLGVERPPVTGHLQLRTPAQLQNSLGLTQHWTGAAGQLFHPNPITRLRGIYDEHVHGRGYGDIAYNGAFDADANTYALRDPRYVGAHALSNRNIANVYTDGIVFLEDKRGWTAGAEQAFQWWVNLFHYAHRRVPQLFTHNWWHDVGGIVTACPGPYITKEVASRHGHV